MTNVMTNAWEIARVGVEKFGGQIKEYFAEALRIAWDLFKKGENEMELIKEVPFGKATARIKVRGTYQNEHFHQFIKGGEVFITKKIEIVHNGKIVDEGSHAYQMEYNAIDARTYEKRNLDKSKTYTQVKGSRNLLFCEGKEVAEKINALIKDMEAEITTHYKGEAEKEESPTAVEKAKEVVEAAERQGIEKLMTAQEIKEWRKNYNNVVNEGGEGYIPQLISKEHYEDALQVLANGE